MEQTTMSVYRFRDSVAVNPPEGPTFYLSHGEARKLATALGKHARSIKKGVSGISDARERQITIGVEK